MMNMSLPIGLSVSADYEGKIQDAHYNELMMKRVKDEQEAKAKMFADDTDYNNAMNSFDNPVVKQFANAKIKEIGAFVNANPDWQSNVNKRIQYKQLIKDLKDNPDLIRGVQSDAAIKKYNDYIGDPKNNEVINTPEFKAETQRMQNYLKYGNSAGEAGKGEKVAYTFMAPEEQVDYTKYLVDIASKTAKHGTAAAAGAGGFRQFVTTADKQSALQMAKSNPMYRYLKKDFAKQKEAGLTKFATEDEFVLDKMQPYFPEDEIKTGQFFAPKNDGDGTHGIIKNPWETAMAVAKNNKAGLAEVSPGTLVDALADKDGNYDLTQSLIINNKTGDKIPMNLGAGKATPIGNLKWVPNNKGGGYYCVPAKIKLPLNQFIKHFGDDAIDYDGFMGGIVEQNNPSSDKWSIHNGDTGNKDYTQLFEKVLDDRGNPYIQFDAELPVQNNEIIASRFNASLDAGKQADAYTSTKAKPAIPTTVKEAEAMGFPKEQIQEAVKQGLLK